MDDDLQDDDDSESEESYDSDEDMGEAGEEGWKPSHRTKAGDEDDDEDDRLVSAREGADVLLIPTIQ